LIGFRRRSGGDERRRSVGENEADEAEGDGAARATALHAPAAGKLVTGRERALELDAVVGLEQHVLLVTVELAHEIVAFARDGSGDEARHLRAVRGDDASVRVRLHGLTGLDVIAKHPGSRDAHQVRGGRDDGAFGEVGDLVAADDGYGDQLRPAVLGRLGGGQQPSRLHGARAPGQHQCTRDDE
jgi:hypothetical protein